MDTKLTREEFSRLIKQEIQERSTRLDNKLNKTKEDYNAETTT